MTECIGNISHDRLKKALEIIAERKSHNEQKTEDGTGKVAEAG